MKKIVIDCSKPEGDPDRIKEIPLTEEEIAAMVAAFEAEQAEPE